MAAGPEPPGSAGATAPAESPAASAVAPAGSAAPAAPVPPSPSPPLVRSSILPRLLLAVLLAVYAAFLVWRFAPAIATPDANGYWAQGSLLFTTGHTWQRPQSDVQYLGMHWLVTPDGRYVSRYPPGLAVPIGLVYRLLGAEASVFVNPALALLALLGLWSLCRHLAGPWWSLLGVAALATNPTFSRHALSCDSHMAVTALLAWGVVALLAWSRSGRLRHAFAAGLLLGAIPTVRYPEALFALGVGVFLLGHWHRHPRIGVHYAVATAGALVPILPVLVRNQLLFGAFWRTAYAYTNEQTGFAWSYFRQHAVHYVRELHGDGVGLLFPLGVIGVVLLCAGPRRRLTGWLFAVLLLPTTLLYMAYYWAPQSLSAMTMRFLLPTFPLYIAAGVWLLQRGQQRLPRSTAVAVGLVLFALQCSWGVTTSLQETATLSHQARVLAIITRALEQAVQPGAVVIAHNQVLQHLDFVRRWRLVDPAVLRDRPFLAYALRRARDPDAPAPMQDEKQEAQAARYQGLSGFERERAIAHDVRTWAAGHGVYFVGSQADFDNLRGFYFDKGYFKTVATVPLPAAPPGPQRESILGGGMRPGPMLGAALGGGPRAGGPLAGGRFGGGRPGPGGGGPGGGPGGAMGFYQDLGKVVIAEWTWTLPPAAAPAPATATARPALPPRAPWRRPTFGSQPAK